MRSWSVVRAVVAKDLRIEARSRTSLVTALLLVVLVQMTIVFARDSGRVGLDALAPGVLWVALALAALLVLNRTFLLERDDDAFDAIRLTPIPREALFLGKWLSGVCLLGAVGLVAFPVWLLFFNVAVDRGTAAVLVLMLLVVPGMSAVGTLLSAIVVRTRAAEYLLPVLLLPALLPPIALAAQTAVRALAGRPWSELQSGVLNLVLYDAGVLILALLLFPMVVDE